MIHGFTIEVASASGVEGDLRVAFDRYEFGRARFHWSVGSAISQPAKGQRVAVETIASGDDLRHGHGDDADEIGAMVALIDFLLSDAEKYGHWMRSHGDLLDDDCTFNRLTAEWAYGVSEELQTVRDDLQEDEAAAFERGAEERDERTSEERLTGGVPDGVCDFCGEPIHAHAIECRVPAQQAAADALVAMLSEDDSPSNRIVVGNYKGWLLRFYPAGGAVDTDVTYDAIVTDGSGISLGCETIAELLDWINDEEDHAAHVERQLADRPVEDAPLRERASHGNVHSEEQR